MHPMFVKLFLENSADDMLAEEEDRRRAANRARRSRSRRTITQPLATGIADPPVRLLTTGGRGGNPARQAPLGLGAVQEITGLKPR